jgi:hypothetical protein
MADLDRGVRTPSPALDVSTAASPAPSSDGERPSQTVARWNHSVDVIRADPELRENILRSVMTSMALEGFDVDREESERLLDEVLDGPPIEHPGNG